MDMQEIEFRIDSEGGVSVRVLGGHGEHCLDQTRDLEEELGIVEERVYAAEFYEKTDAAGVRAELKNSGV